MAGYKCSSSEDPVAESDDSLSSFYLEGVGIPLIWGFGIVGNIVTVSVMRWVNLGDIIYHILKQG